MAIDFKAMLAEERARAARPATTPGEPAAAAPAAPPAAETHPELPETTCESLRSGDAVELKAVEGARMERVALATEFVSAAAEAAIMRCVLSPDYERSGRWVRLRGRRLLQFGGKPSPGPSLVEREPLPGWLERVIDAVMRAGAFPGARRPNHVLVNAYGPGEGILPHTDGPLYHPSTATLSLGSDAVMAFTPRVPTAAVGTPGQRDLEEAKAFELGLPARSLVLFSGEAYTDALHDVPAVTEHVVTARCANAEALGWSPGSVIARSALRISLTIRHVPLES